MKRGMLITYTLIVLLLGASFGGSLVWAFAKAARVELGGQQVGITMLSKNSARIMVYSGPKITNISNYGSYAEMHFK